MHSFCAKLFENRRFSHLLCAGSTDIEPSDESCQQLLMKPRSLQVV